MSLRNFVHAKAIELGKEVIRMTTAAGSGHPSSGLSILHACGTLMYDVMRWDPADPWNPANDRLILSEGHAVPAVYAVYADIGGVVGKSRAESHRLTVAELETLREDTSVLDGHPNPAEGFPFFDAATGSLGQGISVAAGLALASRRRGIDRQFYVLVGDGEAREGQIWEGLDMLVDHKLTNVVVMFNCNGQGQADYVSHQQSAETLAAKARAFGCDAPIIDGHDAEAIRATILGRDGRMQRERPLAMVMKTEKGWGCGALKDKSNHGKPVAADKVEAACRELDGMYEKLGVSRGDARAERRPSMPKGSGSAGASPSHSSSSAVKHFNAGMEAAGMAGALAKNSVATRRAYGAALLALAEVDPCVVALDGDVSNSTFSEILAHKHPERFFECKIAEQNLVSTAVGLAAGGMIPFASSFAKFLARGYDQVELAQIGRANIKLVGSHAGVSLAADGPSQMGLQDVAYFACCAHVDDGFGRPACVSFHPSDAVAAYACTVLMAQHMGMCYMRTHRTDVPLLYKPDTKFEIGGSHTLMKGDAITLVSAGYMVHVCKQAAEMFAKEGVACTLIDAYSFPLKCEPILAAGRASGGRILVVEDNYEGGLGAAVATAAARETGANGVRVETMTCRRIPRSSRTAETMMAYLGLAPRDIMTRSKSMIRGTE